MQNYYVYRHTSPSGKIYIGITSLNTLVPRVNEHSSGFVNNGSMKKLRL